MNPTRRPLTNSYANPARTHPATTVTVDAWCADIDCGIAPLIEALWHLGIETHNSCEDINESGRVLISFETARGAEQFLSVLTARPDISDGLLDRVAGQFHKILMPGATRPARWWTHELSGRSNAVRRSYGWDEQPGPSAFWYGMKIDFQRSDLDEVTRLMRLAAELPG